MVQPRLELAQLLMPDPSGGPAITLTRYGSRSPAHAIAALRGSR